jgi:molecular chaperone IbpA
MLLKEDMTMNTLDLSPLARTLVGFDRISTLLDAAHRLVPNDGYPPYNIEQTAEDSYRISLAVAGFGEGDLSIVQEQNKLTVSGKKDGAEDDKVFLYRGLATRGFQRVFQLADHVKVSNASLQDGLLVIDLVREVPEEQKPRAIAISNGARGGNAKTIESKAA